jgi:hypothetical protein
VKTHGTASANTCQTRPRSSASRDGLTLSRSTTCSASGSVLVSRPISSFQPPVSSTAPGLLRKTRSCERRCYSLERKTGWSWLTTCPDAWAASAVRDGTTCSTRQLCAAPGLARRMISCSPCNALLAKNGPPSARCRAHSLVERLLRSKIDSIRT